MTAIVAWVAESGLGEGRAALGLDDARTAVKRDARLEASGLLRPFCARVAHEGHPDRATALLERALARIAGELDRVRPGWRDERVGLCVGTSSGGMQSFEESRGMEGTYLGPVLAAMRPIAFEPFSLILGACASSVISIGIGRSWIEQGLCDLVIAGGYDGVTTFVASGFEALRATCTETPKPFRTHRDGLALGEGAAFVALARGEGAIYVRGFGASCDAVHLTAPDRTGDGLARAAQKAIADAGDVTIGLVSAHGTATDYNDAAEEKAIARVAKGVPVHALKGAIGHTLGAAGALESLAAAQALREGVSPPSAGGGAVIEGVRVLDVPQTSQARSALKLSAAFGGANAALVLSLDAHAHAHAHARPVFLSQAVAVTTPATPASLSAKTGYSEDKISRADDLVILALTALSEIAPPPSDDTGVVIGHGFATHQTNSVYLARIKSAGAHRAEPRRFPYTSPNAAAGECCVAFGLRGPSFAVGGGPHGGLEALMIARDLVATGAAERMAVIAVDEAGEAARTISPETKRGAVAFVVSANPSSERAARLESVTIRLAEKSDLHVPAAMDAHRALLPLTNRQPESLEALLPWGGVANARLFWL